MDDAARELMELKTLITKTLEKRGVLARIRAELRANVFAAIEEQERETDGNEGNGFTLIGACNERAKELHSSQTGKILSGLVCEYLEWCGLDRTLKVYLPESNIPRGYSRTELQEKLGFASDRLNAQNTEPLLLKLVDEHLKLEVKPNGRASAGAFASTSNENVERLRTLDISSRDFRRQYKEG